MRKLKRFLSGSLLGLAAILALNAFGAQALWAGNGFCDRMEDGSIVCCSTDEDGKILDCIIIPT